MNTSLIDFCELAVPGVRQLQPYQPGKPIEELQRELGIREVIKLASNENPFGPSPKAIAALQTQLQQLSRYPDGNGFILKSALAQKFAVHTHQITLGNGSNDILEFVARTFVQPGDEVVFSQHAFAVYPIVTQAVGGKAVVVAARDYAHDLPAMAKAVTVRTRVIFIANPNNPTGTWFDRDALEQFMQSIPSRVIVVLDEAYFEYASYPAMQADNFPDGMGYLPRFPNLVVSRTFSKVYGLAGLRVGFALSHPGIADLLNRVRQPFNLNSLALYAATAALSDQEHIDKSVSHNARAMRLYEQTLAALQLKFIPSVGNFIAIDMGRMAAPLYDALLRLGVIVRPVASYAMPNHLRVTLGTDHENQVFFRALTQVLGQ
ncbi:MAG: histidinol-phosphate transaminase [Gammaproteobacteria bacterium]|nr:histidinol-phosphate transaminase [Gammaproteobacteria bacterium]